MSKFEEQKTKEETYILKILEKNNIIKTGYQKSESPDFIKDGKGVELTSCHYIWKEDSLKKPPHTIDKIKKSKRKKMLKKFIKEGGRRISVDTLKVLFGKKKYKIYDEYGYISDKLSKEKFEKEITKAFEIKAKKLQKYQELSEYLLVIYSIGTSYFKLNYQEILEKFFLIQSEYERKYAKVYLLNEANIIILDLINKNITIKKIKE